MRVLRCSVWARLLSVAVACAVTGAFGWASARFFILDSDDAAVHAVFFPFLVVGGGISALLVVSAFRVSVSFGEGRLVYRGAFGRVRDVSAESVESFEVSDDGGIAVFYWEIRGGVWRRRRLFLPVYIGGLGELSDWLEGVAPDPSPW